MYSAILMTLVHVWVCASQFKTSTFPPPGYLTVICAQGVGSYIFVYNCDDLHIILHPAILIIYDFHMWITSSSSFHGFTTNQFNDLFPVGLLTQLVRELHLVSQRSRIWVPYKPDFFFSGFLFAAAKVVSITAEIFCQIIVTSVGKSDVGDKSNQQMKI